MKKSNFYFSMFFVLMFGSFLGFYIEPIPGTIALVIFAVGYISMIPVGALMIREENREDLIKHESTCNCDCGRCCTGIKLKKKFGNRK